MKNRIFKILSVLLSIALVFSVCVISASANDTEIPTYYVNAGGVAAEGGDGSGSSIENAAANVNDILGLEAVRSLTDEDTFNVKIVGSSNSDAGRAVVTDGTGEAVVTHAAKMVISPAVDGGTAYLWRYSGNTAFELGGPTEFQSTNVKVYDWANFMMSGHDVKFDDKCTFNPSYGIVTAGSNANKTFTGYNLEINQKFTKTIYIIGKGYVYANTKINGNAEIVINNSESTPTIQITGDNTNVGAGNPAGTFNNNVNINVKSAKAVTFTKKTNLPKIVGNLTAVINAKTITDAEILGEINASSKWVVKNTSADATVSATDTAGTFAVTAPVGYQVTATSGEQSVSAENGILTLEQGVWDITAERIPMVKTYYVAPGGTGDGSIEAPAASVKEIMDKPEIQELEEIDIVNVKIVGSSYSNKAVLCFDGETIAAHKAKLVISDKDNGKASVMAGTTGGESLTLGGPTEFVNTDVFAYMYGSFIGNNKNFTVSSGSTIYNASHTKILLSVINPGYYQTYPGTTATFNNAVSNPIYIPTNGYVNNSSYDGDVNLIVNNANATPKINIGNHTGTIATFKNDLNVNVKSAQSVTFGEVKIAPTIKGAFEVILNADTVTGVENLDSISATGGKWVVTNTTGVAGLVSMTDIAGTYAIKEGYNIQAKCGDVVKTPEENQLVLDAGNWEITLIANTVTVTGGTADVEEAIPGATVTLTADAPAKYMEFAGWEIVSGDATLNGNTLTMGNQAVEVKATYKAIPAFMDIRDLVRFNECGGTDAIGEEFEEYLGMESEVLSLQLIKTWLLNYVAE